MKKLDPSSPACPRRLGSARESPAACHREDPPSLQRSFLRRRSGYGGQDGRTRWRSWLRRVPQRLHWLTLFGWPALAAIILLSLLASPLLLPDKSPPPTGPVAAAADVKYTIRNGQKPIVSEEIAEIRALYASDLFASSRYNLFAASQAATNRFEPKDIIPSENQLFLSFPPAQNETGAPWFAKTGRKTDNYGADSEFRFHAPERTSHRAKKPVGKHPKLSIEIKGELKDFPFSAEIFKDVALPAGRKQWSVQAQMRSSSVGRVEHVLAESTDCEPSIYQEIVRRLYQCHFSNVTQACEGTIIISYPAYFAANTNETADLSKEHNISPK